MNDNTRRIVQIVLTILIIGVGAGGAVKMINAKKEPERAAVDRPGPLVTTMTVERRTTPVRVEAQGTVMPAQTVEIQPELVGRIVKVSPQLVPGGRIAAGEALIELDDRDYRYALDRQRASVERATLALEVEQGRKSIASREWKLLGKEVKTGKAGKRLALREPQIKSARAELSAAKTAVAQARLNLSRTTVKAPFNAMVRTEMAEVGQLVQPGRPVATLVGTDRFWVQVSIPERDLRLITLPDAEGQGGSVARITRPGLPGTARTGRVVRLLGDLDPVGRLARLLVEVEQPLEVANDGDQPLLLGAFVNVTLEGPSLKHVVPVPRVALRAGDTLQVVTAENTLKVIKVDVVHRTAEEVLVGRGLNGNEKVIISRVAAAADGMKVRPKAKGRPLASLEQEQGE